MKAAKHVATLVLAAALLAAVPSWAGSAITPDEAAGHIGERQTVCGKVANTYYSCFVTGKPTFINFGKPYPNHVFSIVIMAEDRAKFDNCPEKMFSGRDVCVTGLIESYDGKPLMAVKDLSQVKWND